jgi:hypothetical protein
MQKQVIVDVLGVKMSHHGRALAAPDQNQSYCTRFHVLPENAFSLTLLKDINDAFLPFGYYASYAVGELRRVFHHLGGQHSEKRAPVKDIAAIHLGHDLDHASYAATDAGLLRDYVDDILHPEIPGALEDYKPEFFFAFEVEIESALGYFRALQNPSYGGVVESVFAKELHCGA